MIYHTKAEISVKDACFAEYIGAKEEHGLKFPSKHNGWDVLDEKIEEVRDELNAVHEQNKCLWEAIKDDDCSLFYVAIESIKKSTIKSMMELAQVWAVCEKMKG